MFHSNIPSRKDAEPPAVYMTRLGKWREGENKSVLIRLDQKQNSERNPERKTVSELRECPLRDKGGVRNPCGARTGSRASKCKGCQTKFRNSDRKRKSDHQQKYRKNRKMKHMPAIERDDERRSEGVLAQEEAQEEKCIACQYPLAGTPVIGICNHCDIKMHTECALEFAKAKIKTCFPVDTDNPHVMNSTNPHHAESQSTHFGMYQCPLGCRKWQVFPVCEGDNCTPSVDVFDTAKMSEDFLTQPKSMWDKEFRKSQCMRKVSVEYIQLRFTCVHNGLLHASITDITISELAAAHGVGLFAFLRGLANGEIIISPLRYP